MLIPKTTVLADIQCQRQQKVLFLPKYGLGSFSRQKQSYACHLTPTASCIRLQCFDVRCKDVLHYEPCCQQENDLQKQLILVV